MTNSLPPFRRIDGDRLTDEQALQTQGFSLRTEEQGDSRLIGDTAADMRQGFEQRTEERRDDRSSIEARLAFRRIQQENAQFRIISDNLEAGMRYESQQVRIGDRIPSTGQYEGLMPDGGTKIGNKIFTRATEKGDPVRAIKSKGDRYAWDEISPDDEIEQEARELSAIGNCRGYINGQVFNCPGGVLFRSCVAWVRERYGGDGSGTLSGFRFFEVWLKWGALPAILVNRLSTVYEINPGGDNQGQLAITSEILSLSIINKNLAFMEVRTTLQDYEGVDILTVTRVHRYTIAGGTVIEELPGMVSTSAMPNTTPPNVDTLDFGAYTNANPFTVGASSDPNYVYPVPANYHGAFGRRLFNQGDYTPPDDGFAWREIAPLAEEFNGGRYYTAAIPIDAPTLAKLKASPIQPEREDLVEQIELNKNYIPPALAGRVRTGSAPNAIAFDRIRGFSYGFNPIAALIRFSPQFLIEGYEITSTLDSAFVGAGEPIAITDIEGLLIPKSVVPIDMAEVSSQFIEFNISDNNSFDLARVNQFLVKFSQVAE